MLIDLEDLEKVKKLDLSWHAQWNDHIKGYYCKATRYLGIKNGKPKYKTVYLHRVVMNTTKGNKEIPDHLNHNSLDNRKSNLKVTNIQKNGENRRGINCNNVSGERNVSWSKSSKKWLVQLQVNGKNKCFGRFKFEELDEAKDLARRKRREIYEAI